MGWIWDAATPEQLLQPARCQTSPGPCREWEWEHRQDREAQAGLNSAGSLLPEYPKEILEMGLR